MSRERKDFSSVTHCITFNDLESKVKRNLNLTDDDVNKCSVTAPEMGQVCKNSNGKNLLNIAIECLNLNNIKKLLPTISPKNCTFNCYHSLFHIAEITAADAATVKEITEILISHHTPIRYTSDDLELIKEKPGCQESIQLLEEKISSLIQKKM